MNRDDVIRMALEAGVWIAMTGENKEIEEQRLERFAALVAAAERNKVAAWMIERSYATGHGDTTEDLLKELDWQIDERIVAEREACAKVCDAAVPQHERFDDQRGAGNAARQIAAAIRARGNT